MGNGITNCYPDEVGKFISITVLTELGANRVEGTPYGNFNPGVLALNPSHQLAALLPCQAIGHTSTPKSTTRSKKTRRKFTSDLRRR